ncbi:arylsulfatase B-like [Watersipora subatra]|uniref:arylsulfatase B-like n=1 Tax=Watersipora subatra TaxID=2589382 RepID=UPI00355B3209
MASIAFLCLEMGTLKILALLVAAVALSECRYVDPFYEEGWQMDIDSACDYFRDRNNKQPNIVYIMADDLGWNDVGFHNSKVKTPNIDALRAKGIELTQSYMQPVCSASRSAFLTGKYPSNNGLQLLVLIQEAPSCLPIEHKTLFQYMQEEGYTTKQVGKWHLGYCDENCLPNSRGVHEFRGVNTGAVDYWNWTDHGVYQRQKNGQPNVDGLGNHLTVQDQIDVRELILAHQGRVDPLFMWLTPTAPHDPLQPTIEMYNVHNFLNPANEEENYRREYLGLVAHFDALLGTTMQALEEAGMADNTIILFTSDNGGASQSVSFGGHEYFANNYPLRGGKTTFSEGGVRIPTVYYDPRLHPRTQGTSRDFLIHVTDWLPTFVQLAKKGSKECNFKIKGTDGVSQLANLGSTYNLPERRKYNLRKEMLVALSDATGDVQNPSMCATEDGAYRWKDYKLIYGDQYYLTDPATVETEWPIPQEWPEYPAIYGDDCHRTVNGMRVVRCLFNVVDDPSETHNLYDEEPEIVKTLVEKIQAYKEMSVKPVYRTSYGVTGTTTQGWNYGYIIPRHDYCYPPSNFPLQPNDPSCY